MQTSDALAAGRAAFDAFAWEDAYGRLTSADRAEPLEGDDLHRLATAAFLTGRDASSTTAWERAHHAFLGHDDVPAAVRTAFWVAFTALQRGEPARAGGWLSRARRLLASAGRELVEGGYLLFPLGLGQFLDGDAAAAHDTFMQAAQTGQRFADADLTALARHAQGRALLRLEDTAGGLALLDEAMVSVTAGETSPVIAGTVYCSVIEACHEVFDLSRAAQWTDALTQWCAQQPDLVPYRGQCLVHRVQLRVLRGQWAQAMVEVEHACARLSDPPGQAALGLAWYQQAELHRLRGDLRAAAATYQRASERGHVPQPGLALLCLAQGRATTASASIRLAVAGAGTDRAARARLLPAQVEILCEAGELADARASADELEALAAHLGTPLLEATAAHAQGMVLLAADEAQAALGQLRRAWTRWWELRAPYEAARVRVLIGRACALLGDPESARLEVEAARQVFDDVGAAPDLRRLEELTGRRSAPAGLSPRELEVLALVAAGKTNQEIAGELVISLHTVRRHLQNIFSKIDVPSRAAATAYAYEHDLLRGRDNDDTAGGGVP